jgi:hypothetical protein
MRKRKHRRIDWFDDWRDWFVPRAYGLGWTARNWKGALATGVVVCVIALLTVVLNHFFR